MQEAQNERAEIRDDFNSLLKLSEIKSKKLRNLYTDRFIADMQARGKVLPADFVEAFKKTGIDEGQQMAKLLEPLLTESGLDPAVATQLLAEGRSPEDIMDAMELAQKQKKLRLEQQEITGLDASRQQMFGTLGDVSGTASPPAPTQASPAANVGMRATDGGKEPLPIRMNNPLNIGGAPAGQPHQRARPAHRALAGRGAGPYRGGSQSRRGATGQGAGILLPRFSGTVSPPSLTKPLVSRNPLASPWPRCASA